MGKRKKIKYYNIIALIFIVIIIFFAGIKYINRIIFKDYYSGSDSEYIMPNTMSDFVPKGIAYCKEKDCLFINGYTKDKMKYGIYILDGQNKFVQLSNMCDLSIGNGMCIALGHIYIANGFGIDIYNLEDIISDFNDETIYPVYTVKTDVNASFCCIYNEKLYVGETCRNNNSINNHSITTDSGDQHNALIEVHDLSEDDYCGEILYAYSICNNVCGMCFNDSENICLSCSDGKDFSYLKMYTDPIQFGNDGIINLYDDEVKLYFLDSTHNKRNVKLFPNISDIDYGNKKVYILSDYYTKKSLWTIFVQKVKIYSYHI